MNEKGSQRGPKQLWELGHREHQGGGDTRTHAEKLTEGHGIITENEPDEDLKKLLEKAVQQQ